MPHDLLCFSHLRWDFVYQRPNHLMTRAAADRRVFFVEEPLDLPVDGPAAALPRLDRMSREDVSVVVPRLPATLQAGERTRALAAMIDGLVRSERIERPVRWYYTPMSLPWSEQVPASAVVYDCMDDLSGFRAPPAGLQQLEARLLGLADLVFTGGRQLYEARRTARPHVHLFPSSVDTRHFRRARVEQPDPPDQAPLGHPRLGYFGVVDERMDLELVGGLADRHPGWQIILLGPTAKIDPGDVPVRQNIHRIGPRAYADLPAYLAGWDVAIMPFAHNSATRYISPTKTPEYLAGGRPVASTAIADVVDPYGRRGLVEIGDGLDGFEQAVERALATDRRDLGRRADAFLAGTSWDRTWAAMSDLLEDAIERGTATEFTVPARDGLARVAAGGAGSALADRPRIGGAAMSGAATIGTRGRGGDDGL